MCLDIEKTMESSGTWGSIYVRTWALAQGSAKVWFLEHVCERTKPGDEIHSKETDVLAQMVNIGYVRYHCYCGLDKSLKSG